MEAIMKTTADRWHEACRQMRGTDGKPNFDHTAFNFKDMKPVYNGKWREPDSAAGIAWLEYMAWLKFKDPKYLQATKSCLQFLNERQKNPYYEIQLPFGAYTAVRMNAELQTDYDCHKMINWCFSRSDARPSMNVIAAKWEGYDCHGLVGGVNRRPFRPQEGGYAFTMNTFNTAWPLIPMVRYDDRYARSIAKWILNAANAARLFYPDAHPAERQSCPDWRGDPGYVIAYEGLRQHWDGDEALFASGDPVKYKWPFKTDFGIYGSAFVGVFGGIIKTTNIKYILQLDCLATDSFFRRAYPTYLYFNPYDNEKEVRIKVGPQPKDLYDAVRDKFIKKNASGTIAFGIAADSAALIVIAPVKGKLIRQGNKTFIDNVVVDFRNNAAQDTNTCKLPY
jgi:hypothetical protein